MTHPTCLMALLCFNESTPLTKISPLVGLIRPVMDLRVVLLPAPFGPRRPMNSPFFTVMERLSTAVNEPNLLVRFVTFRDRFPPSPTSSLDMRQKSTYWLIIGL